MTGNFANGAISRCRAIPVVVVFLILSGIRGIGAEDGWHRTLVPYADSDVIPTGNEWIALPDIRAVDGSLGSFNVLSMRDRGLLQVTGERGAPVLKPVFAVDGKEITSAKLSWELIEYWIPTAHFSARGVDGTITYCVPPGSRAALLSLTLTNKRPVATSVSFGLHAAWGALDRVTYTPVELRGERTMVPAPWADSGRVFAFITHDTHFAWSLLYPASTPTFHSAPVTVSPGLRTERETVLAPGESAEVHYVLGVGLEEYSAAQSAQALQDIVDRNGTLHVIDGAAAWCRKRTRTTGQPDLDLIRADSGLASTPPMGWNSWNAFQLQVNEIRIKKMADPMAVNGMKDAGYAYLVVDAGWKANTQDAMGKLVADPAKFPSGMKALAEYVHEKGFKFGIYTDAGAEDCVSGAPGSQDHEEIDARTFASWGVDYVKEDWCHSEGLDAKAAYKKMSRALQSTGRPMMLSVCEWGDNEPWLWASDLASLWRTTGDGKDCWDCGGETAEKKGGYPRGWTRSLDAQVGLEKYAGPGHWNDPDLLLVGLPGLSAEEARAQFSLWAILAAPLMASCDLANLPTAFAEILKNKDVIEDRPGRGRIGGNTRIATERAGSVGQAATGWRQGDCALQPKPPCRGHERVCGRGRPERLLSPIRAGCMDG